MESGSATPGAPCSGDMPSRTASTWRRSTGSEKRSRGRAAKGIEFWGSSFLCGPQGEILTEASVEREEILFAEVDLARIEEVRRNWPFLRDRRIDAYGGITSRVLDDEAWGKGR